MENEIKTTYMNKIKLIIISVVAIFLGAGTMYGLIYLFPTTFIKETTKLEKKVTISETGIAESVEKVYDSVVVVSTYKNNVLASSGTGFVYQFDEKNAYILTNYHVIENGTEIHVTFTNGKQEVVNIEGGDKYSDIAVLSLPVDRIIAVAELGKSKLTRVGDTVFAVGAPLDDAYSWSVTRGILSGKDRFVEVSLSNNSRLSADYVMSVLQTDAAINSGNSGGPLSNSNGEVIGITSLKLVSSGVEGMGFAIPIETAIEYATKILNKEAILRPYLGISMLNVSDGYYSREFAKYLEGLNLVTGVIVTDVENDSDASKGGLQVGDIITSVDNKKVKSLAFLRYELYSRQIGDTINVEYFRNGEKNTTNIKLTKSYK